jgi:hypothetical protein
MPPTYYPLQLPIITPLSTSRRDSGYTSLFHSFVLEEWLVYTRTRPWRNAARSYSCEGRPTEDGVTYKMSECDVRGVLFAVTERNFGYQVFIPLYCGNLDSFLTS